MTNVAATPPRVRFTVALREDDYERLMQLMALTGVYSRNEAVRDAVRFTHEGLTASSSGAPAA
jgi:metal-responsive CopG/Arc/MetJ family transcriptional regulator